MNFYACRFLKVYFFHLTVLIIPLAIKDFYMRANMQRLVKSCKATFLLLNYINLWHTTCLIIHM